MKRSRTTNDRFCRSNARRRLAFGLNPLWLIAAVVALVLPGHPAQASHRPADAPKIVNWNFRWSIDSDFEADELAEWDALIIDVEAGHFSRQRLKRIKEHNPEIKILAYISLADIRRDAATLDESTTRYDLGRILKDNPDWILRKKNGSPAEWWPGNYIFNITDEAPKNADGKRFNQVYARYLNEEVVQDKIWDGVFFDNLWEGVAFVGDDLDLDLDGSKESTVEANRAWRAGTKKILKKVNRAADNHRNGKFIITGNGGTRYYEQINGVGLEHFPTTSYGNWTESMEEYSFIIQNALPRQYAWINTNTGNTGARDDYKKFRYGLISTLLNDGYYSFDNGDQSHREQWYYDEYDVSLGRPVSGAYNLQRADDPTTLRSGVWRRDFERASVFVNSTGTAAKVDLHTGFEKVHGEQDPATNSGENVGSITVPANDGIILLRRLTEVRDATFINGAFSKVFDGQGTQVRNSFFAFDGSFAGGTQIHKVARSGKSVVADTTWVRVYDTRNQQIAAFAPYGDGYNGGVNIAVGPLYGGTKRYIVTGNKTGAPHVRIWDMNGTLVHAGCNPYGAGFTGGVNIGVGDLNGDRRQEIVVAAGFGGGPHIRVMNNQCQIINPGFFAFPQELRIGVNMAVGDLNDDGKAEIIAASGPGGGPHVRIFNKNGEMLSAGFFAYAESDRSGVLVATADVDNDGDDEIVTNSFSIFNQF